MRALFLNPPFGHQRPEGLDAPMGIMYLGAVLREQGHMCEIVDHAWEKDQDWSRWGRALAEKPDVVLINTQLRFGDDTHEAVRRVRSQHSSMPIIAFGPQASTEAPNLLSRTGVDVCVIGEPEEVVPEFLNDLDAGRVPESRSGLATAENPSPGLAPRVDVTSLPFPDWDLVDYGRYISTTHNAVFMASRGIDKQDAFNQPPLIYATNPTCRCTVDRAINELTEIRRRFPGRYMLLFHDEVFTENREWVIELCSRLRESRLDLPYWCFTRPDLLDAELCRAMSRAGFAGVSMGMESGSNRILALLERDLTVSEIEGGFKAAQQAGLLTVGSAMLGTPGCIQDTLDETLEEIAATASMTARLHPDVLTVTLTTPLPGTRLYDYTRDKIQANSMREFNYYDVWPGKYPVRLDGLTPDDLATGVRLIRRAWKRGLWLTAWRVVKATCRNGALRNTILAQVLKAVRRKVLPCT